VQRCGQAEDDRAFHLCDDDVRVNGKTAVDGADNAPHRGAPLTISTSATSATMNETFGEGNTTRDTGRGGVAIRLFPLRARAPCGNRGSCRSKRKAERDRILAGRNGAFIR